MLIKVALLFAMALAAVGLGAPLLRLIAPSKFAARPWPAGVAGMMGLFVAASAAIVVNFVIPVVPSIGIGLIAIGLLLFAFVARRLDPLSWVTLAALAIVVAPLAVWNREGYDGGLYHLPAQLWMATERIVFGLANLHGRFGFNSLNESLLSLGWVNENDLAIAQLMAGLFSLFFLMTLVDALRAASDDPILQFLVAMTGIGFFWIHTFVTVAMGWTGTDLPTAIATLLTVYFAFIAMTRNDRDGLALSFFFAALAIGWKASAGIVVLVPVAAAVVLARRGDWRKLPFGQVALIALLFVPWLARSLILSGCVAYPLAASCLPVAWEASAEAQNDAVWVLAWARAPATGLEHLTGWAWLPIWYELRANFLVSWVEVAAVGVVVALVLRHWGAKRPFPVAAAIIFSVYAVFATAFWFLLAPDPRFGMAQLLMVAMLPGLWLLVSAGSATESAIPQRLVAAILAVSVVASVGYSWRQGNGDRTWIAYRPNYFGAVPTEPHSGTVRHPTDTDRCFLSEPPCTPPSARMPAEGQIGVYRAFYAKG